MTRFKTYKKMKRRRETIKWLGASSVQSVIRKETWVLLPPPFYLQSLAPPHASGALLFLFFSSWELSCRHNTMGEVRGSRFDLSKVLRNTFRNNFDEELTVVRKTERDNET